MLVFLLLQNNILDYCKKEGITEKLVVKGIIDQYKAAVHANTREQFHTVMQGIKDSHPQVHGYLLQVHVEEWAASMAPIPTYGIAVSSFAGMFILLTSV